MHRHRAMVLAALAAVAACPGAALVGAAHASPAPDAVVIRTRLENACPGSLLFTTNAYPAEITFDEDSEVGCPGSANLHDWRFSEGGATAVAFQNGDIFMFGATLTISGPGAAEAGLQIAPWFTSGVGGRFNVNSATGSITCGGGVLPPYDFTAAHGVQYAPGEAIRLEINYVPRGNSAAEPAWIEYKLDYAGEHYTSGLVEMTNCDPADEATYGCYGILNDARAGGYARMLWPQGGNEQVVVSFTDVAYAPEGKATPVESAQWGTLKLRYR